jgi:hypothetical protein
MPCEVGPLSPRHGASSGFGWRRRLPDMEGTCEYIEQAAAEADNGWSSSRGLGVGLTAPHRKKISLLRKITRSLGPGRNLSINDLSERKWI